MMKCLISVIWLLVPVFVSCSEVEELSLISKFSTTPTTPPTTPNSLPIKIPVGMSPKKLSAGSFFACLAVCSNKDTQKAIEELFEKENPLDKAMKKLLSDSKASEEVKSGSSTTATSAAVSDSEDSFPLDSDFTGLISDDKKSASMAKRFNLKILTANKELILTKTSLLESK